MAETNRLLAALPPEEYQGLLPWLTAVPMRFKQVLLPPHQPLAHVYFPRTGMVSLLVPMEDGAAVEIATVGNEGLLGMALFLGPSTSQLEAVCQIAGEAARMEAAAFREMVEQSRALHRLLHGYAQARFDQVVQTAACNRHHSTEERCARWLLMTQDRVLGDTFPLTHELLAHMLDVRRATVTLVASALQHAGYIRYARGRVTVLDRAGLEAVACECYRRVRATYERLIG